MRPQNDYGTLEDTYRIFRAPCGAAGFWSLKKAHVVEAFCGAGSECDGSCQGCHYMAILDAVKAAHGYVSWETKPGWEEAEDAIMEW